MDKTPGSIVSSFYYYYDVKVLAEMAKVLGKQADAKVYGDLAAAIKTAFHREYFDPKTRNYANGTQTANALPLFLDMVPDGERGGVWGTCSTTSSIRTTPISRPALSAPSTSWSS